MYYTIIMIKQGRTKQGKFLPKSEEHRQVRSIRLTDNSWEALGKFADYRGITRADLLEEWFKEGSFIYEKRIKRLESELENYRSLDIDKLNKIAFERCITLNELVDGLLSQNDQPKVNPLGSKFTKHDLEEFRDQALSSLPVSSKTTTYKRAQDALNNFIRLIGFG